MNHPLHVTEELSGSSLHMSTMFLSPCSKEIQGMGQTSGGPFQPSKAVFQKSPLPAVQDLHPGLSQQVLHHLQTLFQQGGGFSYGLIQETQQPIQVFLAFRK